MKRENNFCFAYKQLRHQLCSPVRHSAHVPVLTVVLDVFLRHAKSVLKIVASVLIIKC